MNLTVYRFPDIEYTVSFRMAAVGFLQRKEEAWDAMRICS
jgi:hypothetical protein